MVNWLVPDEERKLETTLLKMTLPSVFSCVAEGKDLFDIDLGWTGVSHIQIIISAKGAGTCTSTWT